MSKPDVSSKKDKIKIFRSILQALFLFIILIFLWKAWFTFRKYKPFQISEVTENEQGFIAISYFGVDRNGNNYLVSTKQLDEQLEVLYQHGYKTITQKDIQNYYESGTPLPEKALFLMFEDGRRDTAIFAQKIMEKYNYKATMMSYAEKFSNNEGKFLVEKDLVNLEDSTFWELGTNGYRLAYINVFDRYDHYIGELTSLEYQKVTPYLGRNYNHFLMDFIRDEDGIPKESRSQMTDRIKNDYALMEKIYTESVGSMPDTYAIMHANTGAFGNNDRVSSVNRECIEELFRMNFNREGYSYNNLESGMYDLTRMQLQPYWSTNHLLMRIKGDTGENVTFVEGDSKKKKQWEVLEGAAEFAEDKIILTTESKGYGLAHMKELQDMSSFYCSMQLTGNIIGGQTIYFRADEERNSYTGIRILDNFIYVVEKTGSEEMILFELDLCELDKNRKISVEEDEREALIQEYETLMQYSDLTVKKEEYSLALEQAKEMNAASIEDGAKEYKREIRIGDLGSRLVEFFVEDNVLSVWVDKENVVKDLVAAGGMDGNVFLEARWSDTGFSQSNVADDVYDGVFESFYISSDIEGNNIIFDQRIHGVEKVKKEIMNTWEKVLNWFITYL